MEVGLFDALSIEFGKDESPKEGAGPSGEPFVHRNQRAVVLLNLLLRQRKTSNKGNLEVAFNHAARVFYQFE
jgi:hypothetical protein